MIIIYDWRNDAVKEEIYFEVYYPGLESFRAVEDELGVELLMVGSRVGEDRFIRWIIVNELAPGNL